MTASRLQERQKIDLGLSALLAVQALTLFVAIPLGASHPASRLLFDACHLAFAGVCVAMLTRHRVVQGALIAALALLALGPIAGQRLSGQLGLDGATIHDAIALVAFAFNSLVTALVVRHVFGSGHVTAHRVQGAVLVYLNVAALFAIAYGMILSHVPGAIAVTSGALPSAPGAQSAEMTYFSLATITTTGYGDVTPVHPLARSLTNLESVFGQLFPATLLARLVALQLAHGRGGEI